MPPRRVLKATPSNAKDLCDFQHKLLSDVKLLHDELREKRQPFLEVAQTYAKSFCQDLSIMGVKDNDQTLLGGLRMRLHRWLHNHTAICPTSIIKLPYFIILHHSTHNSYLHPYMCIPPLDRTTASS